MHAIIETGGKQYRLKEGDVVDIELVKGNEGEEIQFSEVLLISDGKTVKVGKPNVAGASVKAKIQKTVKDDKKVIFKYKRRKNCHVKKGHRQNLSRVEITAIEG